MILCIQKNAFVLFPKYKVQNTDYEIVRNM